MRNLIALLTLLTALPAAAQNAAQPGYRCIPAVTAPASFAPGACVGGVCLGIWCPSTGPYANTLVSRNIAGVDSPIVACVPTTAGDYCGWNGSAWTREPAPTGGSPILIAKTTPLVGVSGDAISVIGQGFSGLTAGSVLIGGTSATFTASSNTLMSVTLPATAGPLQIGQVSGDNIDVFDTSGLKMILNSTRPDPRTATSATGVVTVAPSQEAALAITTGGLPFSEPSSIDWTMRYIWQPNITDGYLVYGTINAGQWSVITTGNATSFTPTANGVAQVAAPIITAGGGVAAGDEVQLRWKYDNHAFANQNTIIAVNGVEFTQTGQGGPTATTLNTVSALYLGSNNGASTFGGKMTYFGANTGLDQVSSPEIVIFGDSTSAGNGTTWKPVATQIYTPSERWTRQGIFSFAQGGATIATQKALFDSITSYIHTTNIKAIIVTIGVNDLAIPHTAATVITDLQAFITDIKTNAPAGTKIILCEILPTNTVNATDLATVNTAIMGGGGTPITSVDVRDSASYNALNDGTGNAKMWYQQGDNLHPNNAFRDIIAKNMRADLRTTAVLP